MLELLFEEELEVLEEDDVELPLLEALAEALAEELDEDEELEVCFWL